MYDVFSLEINFSLGVSSGKAYSEHPSFQILDAKFHYSIKKKKKKGFLEEMADSGSGTGSV